MEEKTPETVKPDSTLFVDAFRASPIGIALEDLEGRPLFVNPALCNMLGFSEDELCSRHCVEFSPSEDAQKDWALFEQVRAGSIDHYQLDKRFIRRDGSLIWGRLSISLLNHRPSPLVVAMVEDITEKKTTQETLELATEQVVAVIRCSRDFRFLWANQGYATLIQRPLHEIVDRPIVDVLGNEVFETLRPYFERVLNGRRIGYDEEIDYRDIGRRWISVVHAPTFEAHGAVSGWVSTVVDITERKLAEEALSTASQRLIEAQEQERSRLARELHDDINQRMALLAASLDRMKHSLPSSSPQLGQRIEELSKEIVDIAKDVQAMSHRLHSPKLELLGLAATAESFCREFSELHHVEIEYRSENVSRELSPEISLSLFRILQEALQNVVKHSGSRHVQVSLTGEANEIELTVHDSGSGFKPEEAIRGRGLGLTSMKERIKLVDGKLSIKSELGRGTTLCARVPLGPKATSAGAPS